jgi:ABC-type multidrug transport system ATPase subunit
VGPRARRAFGGAAGHGTGRDARLVREIGLGYLSLDRPSGTLSGGEAQRTKLIRHLGSSLTDVTYVFDEPTTGLHPHDIQRMNDLLLRLRDKGNTVLVVEHEPETIAIADHVVDLGPAAGTAGGQICFEGTVDGLRGATPSPDGISRTEPPSSSRCGRPTALSRSAVRRRTTCAASTSTSHSAYSSF